MVFRNRRRLFPEEEKMNLARYYHEYPLREIDIEQKKQLDETLIPVGAAIHPKDFTSWFLPTGKYLEHEIGCCLLEDGTGYVVTYMPIPETVKPEMILWFLHWVGIKPKGSVMGHGNLRYKIWNPTDHFDHHFVNWIDESEGVFSIETMDMGAGDRQSLTIRRPLSLKVCGLSDEQKQILRNTGCITEQCASWESLNEQSSHILLSQIRPRVEGGYERRSVRWVGVRPGKGGLFRTEQPPCDLDDLRKIAHHGLVEWQHLISFLPELYAEYRDKPLDAD